MRGGSHGEIGDSGGLDGTFDPLLIGVIQCHAGVKILDQEMLEGRRGTLLIMHGKE